MEGSRLYKWLGTYSSLFIWVIVCAILSWWIVYIKNPEIVANYDHIGKIDRSFLGIKQTITNLPILISFSILIAFKYLLICILIYWSLNIFKRSHYSIFISIPFITVIFYLNLNFGVINKIGIEWFELDFASDQLLKMVDNYLSVVKILGILAYTHFVILLILKRNQPFPKPINISVIIFFGLWWTFYFTQVIFTSTEFNFSRLFNPNNHFIFGLFLIVPIMNLFKQINWKFLITLFVLLIIYIQIKFSIKSNILEFAMITAILTSYILILFGLIVRQRNRMIPILIGSIIFSSVCILNVLTFNTTYFLVDSIPFSWSWLRM